MSCGHGHGGCGPSYGGAYGRGWYDPVEWCGPEDWSMARRRRRFGRMDREAAPEELEERLSALRDEIRRVEAELGGLRRTEGEPA
jgi:hypothetical protein